MSTIALVGAGGKMGCRIADNLKKSAHTVHYLEVAPAGIERLRERGIAVSRPEDALPFAEAVILGVPDVAIEAVSKEVVARMKPGAMLILLDPAAPLAGKVAQREGIGYFVAHPCHPSVFNWEPTEAAFRDFYGGITAKQSIVCTLMTGSEADYVFGEELATLMYGPVKQAHRLTLEQMATLEPALVEMLAQTCIEVVREGYDKAVALGVPEQAARDFLLGHLRIQMAVLFGEVSGGFSDAAYKISKLARPILFKDNWQRIFDIDDIRSQVGVITNVEPPA